MSSHDSPRGWLLLNGGHVFVFTYLHPISALTRRAMGSLARLCITVVFLFATLSSVTSLGDDVLENDVSGHELLMRSLSNETTTEQESPQSIFQENHQGSQSASDRSAHESPSPSPQSPSQATTISSGDSQPEVQPPKRERKPIKRPTRRRRPQSIEAVIPPAPTVPVATAGQSGDSGGVPVDGQCGGTGYEGSKRCARCVNFS